MAGGALLLWTALTAQTLPVPEAETIRFSECVGGAAITLERRTLRPEQVIDAALARCRQPEADLRAAYRRLLGAARGDQAMRERRASLRAAAISHLGELRGLPPTVDNAETRGAHWGNCVVVHARAMIAGDATPAAIAETALQACVAEERQVELIEIAQSGRAQVGRQMARYRDFLRGETVRFVTSMRAAR